MNNRLDHNKNDAVKRVSQPLFSIIITAYNRAQLLKRALNSLISQTEKDWEAIIVDDQSTDNTYSQVLPYLRSCTKIKYVRKAHSGAALSKNEGMRACSGKFVSFLDSDDEYDPNHLEFRKAILMRNPFIRFLYGGVRIIGNPYVPDRFNPAQKIHLDDCIIGGSFFIERGTLFSLGGFRNIPLGSDADLFDRVKQSQIPLMAIKESTYIYHHEIRDSITNSMYLKVQYHQGQFLMPAIVLYG
jgi:glycosyltransferase involved in cell wall biosynthesis